MEPKEFLTAELAHAERQLARVRRIAARMEDHHASQGLDEVAVYEKLNASRAYRQLLRDQVTFQQVWLRVHRHLERLPSQPESNAAQQAEGIPFEQAFAAAHAAVLAAAPAAPGAPYRKPPTPGPNQKCLCGSNMKYKKCCGNPILRAAA